MLQPPHHGTKRFRLALLLGAGLAHFVPGAALAQASTLASDTMRTCEANPDFDDSALAALTDLGWRALAADDHDAFVARLRDASVATARDLTEPVDWAAAVADAQSMAEDLLVLNDPALLTLLVQDDAALAVVDLSDDEAFVTRCVYGGPIDAEQSLTFDTVARADDGVGITQGDPDLHGYSMQNAWIEGETQLEMTVQAARYLPSATEQLGRAPAIEMGFSLFAIAEN